MTKRRFFLALLFAEAITVAVVLVSAAALGLLDTHHHHAQSCAPGEVQRGGWCYQEH